MGKYFNCNGELLLQGNAVFHTNNRAFNYGDGFFETIRCLNSSPFFLDNHYERIIHTAKKLKLTLPDEFGRAFLKSEIYRLLQRNRIYKGARVRVTIYRDAGGLYTPQSNMAHFIITADPLPKEHFELNAKGITIEVYPEQYKVYSPYSDLKTCNSLLYVMAGIWKKELGVDDCLLKNQDELIIEGLSSNVFMVKEGEIFTPRISSGCVAGTMRRNVFELAQTANYKLTETTGFSIEDLFTADEVFLSNAIQGIVYVKGYRLRRYFHTIARDLLSRLNVLALKQT